MNTPIYKKKFFGILVMVVLVVVGSLVGCFISLNSMYDDAVKIYYNGEDSDGICVRNDLIKRAECGINMNTLASRYPETVSSDAAEELANTAAELKNAASSNSSRAIHKAYTANSELAYAMENVYRIMENSNNISEQDKRLYDELYAEFESRGNTIRHDAYNTAALEYNTKTSGIMAEFVKIITPAKDAVIFS